jgi:hypothetical protein
MASSRADVDSFNDTVALLGSAYSPKEKAAPEEAVTKL